MVLPQFLPGAPGALARTGAAGEDASLRHRPTRVLLDALRGAAAQRKTVEIRGVVHGVVQEMWRCGSWCGSWWGSWCGSVG